MFQAVLVESKKVGKGVKRSYPPITDIDLERIAEYFTHNHMNLPNPKKLQQQVTLYIIYFFCRCGRENLYTMQQDTFSLITQPDGSQIVVKNIDEADKNHSPDDNSLTNSGKMFQTGGNCCLFSHKFNYNIPQNSKDLITKQVAPVAFRLISTIKKSNLPMNFNLKLTYQKMFLLNINFFSY